MFERRVEVSEQQTRDQVTEVADGLSAVSERLEQTRQSLADVQQQLSGRLEQAATQDSDLVQQARDDVSFASFAAVFARADELAAISEFGLRAVVPGQWERLRMQWLAAASGDGDGDGEAAQRKTFVITIEQADGTGTDIKAVWQPGQSPVDALAELAEAWKRAGSYPGDHAMDAGRIFGRLLLGLEIAIKGRRTLGDGQLDPLIEMLSANWAMTDFGLEHFPDYYPIRRVELISDDALQSVRQHMREKIWVDEENAAARASGDADFWMVTQVAHSYYRAKHKLGRPNHSTAEG